MSDRNTATRLYIGNIRRNSREQDLRRLFEPIGRMDNFVYYGDDEAYCEFRKHEDAEYAIRKLDGYSFEGRRLLVEWALVSLNRRPSRDFREPREYREPREPRERMEDKKCYICGETGHIQRDCKDFRRRPEEPRGREDEELGRRREPEESRADRRDDRSDNRSVERSQGNKNEPEPRQEETREENIDEKERFIRDQLDPRLSSNTQEQQ